MANEIWVTVIGNLAADLDARIASNGKPMATGRLVHAERIYDRQDQKFKDADPNFFDIVIFDPGAGNAVESFQKGSRVVVHGKLRVNNFERKDGSKGTAVQIVVDEIAASSKFKRLRIEDSAPAGQRQGGGYQNGGYQQGGQPQQDPWAASPQDQAAQSDPFVNSASPADSYGPAPSNSAPDDAFGGW